MADKRVIHPPADDEWKRQASALLNKHDARTGYSYAPDASEADQGATASGTGDTIYDIVNSVGTSKYVTIFLKHTGDSNTTTYTFDTSLDLSLYPYIWIEVQPGAVLARTTGDEILTIHSPDHFIVSKDQKITAVDMLAFAEAGVVYPKWWGATADGSTDDSSSLGMFFTAAEGGTAYLTNGTYMAKNLEIQDDTRVVGESFNAIIKTISTAEVDNHLLRLNEKSNVTIEGIQLDGNSANTPGDLNSGITMLYLYGSCENVVVKNNIITDNDYVGIRITGTDANTGSSSKILIDGNIITDTDTAVITGHVDLTDLIIVNNIIRGGTSEGINVWGHSTAKQGESHIVIANNSIDDKVGGIELRWANYVNIAGNNIHDSTNGINLCNSSTYCSEINITGNTFKTLSNCGIQGPLEDSIVSGNMIVDCDSCGIWLYPGSKNTVVSNNNIRDVDLGNDGNDGIRIQDGVNVTISNNVYTDTSSYAYAGIRIYGSSGSNCMAVGNHIKGVGTYSIMVNDQEDVVLVGNHVEDSGSGDYAIDSTLANLVSESNFADGVAWCHRQNVDTATSTALMLNVPSRLNSSTYALTMTLADGSCIGQQKMIAMAYAGNNATLTIAHHETADDEEALFDAVDEYLLLVWTGTEWATVSATCTFP